MKTFEELDKAALRPAQRSPTAHETPSSSGTPQATPDGSESTPERARLGLGFIFYHSR